MLAYRRGVSLLAEAIDDVGNLRMKGGHARDVLAKALPKLEIALEVLAEIDPQTLPPSIRLRLSRDPNQ